MADLGNVKVTVKDVGATYRDVADACRTTIGLEESDKPVSEKYMLQMYRCEHSPIRLREFKVVVENCPSWVATHFCRHHIGIEKFVSTQRTDRTNVNRDKEPQDAPVRLQMQINAQAFINISRKRLCTQASSETRKIWIMILEELAEIDYPLYRSCVAECVYRGHCPEYKPCGYTKTALYNIELENYRTAIDEF